MKTLAARPVIKKVAIGLVIIIVAMVLFVYFKSTKPEQPQVQVKEKVWPIYTITADVGAHSPMQTLYGTVESNQRVTAASPVAGVVASVWVREGDTLEPGSKLVALNEADIELPYQIAKADVADTDAQLKLQALAYEANQKRLERERKVLKIKQLDVQRNENLIKKDLVSKAALDASKEALVKQDYAVVGAELAVKENQAKVSQLKARLEKANANLEQAKLNRERGVVTVPYAARVASVEVAEGDRVGVNTPLVSYYALDSLELRAKIPASILGSVYQAVSNDRTVKAIWSQNNQTYALALKRLAGEATTSGLDAFFELPVSDTQVRPGDLLTVRLQEEPVQSSVAVPYSALYGSDRVYRVQKGRLESVKVTWLGETLINGEVWPLVKGPIGNGDHIAVTHLPNAISGLKVSVMETKP